MRTNVAYGLSLQHGFLDSNRELMNFYTHAPRFFCSVGRFISRPFFYFPQFDLELQIPIVIPLWPKTNTCWFFGRCLTYVVKCEDTAPAFLFLREADETWSYGGKGMENCGDCVIIRHAPSCSRDITAAFHSPRPWNNTEPRTSPFPPPSLPSILFPPLLWLTLSPPRPLAHPPLPHSLPFLPLKAIDFFLNIV
ncbi:unnamed protein product [Gadus morhua 'NCC']